jgi:hypothetical protein
MNRARIVLLCLVVVAALSLGGVVLASSTAATPAVPWRVISGGGAFAAAEGVTLDGSIGQAIVGWSASPLVTLHAGYWQALAQGPTTFLPLVLK